MEILKQPAGGSHVTTADLQNKMSELSAALSGALVERQVRLHAAGAIITIVGVLVAYRLGRRRGFRETY